MEWLLPNYSLLSLSSCFLAACFVQSVAGFSLAWSRRISVPSRQGFPLLSSSCFLGDAVIPFTPSGGNDGGQRSSCGAGAGSHFKLSFSLCVRRGKGTAPSRGSLDADIKGLWKRSPLNDWYVTGFCSLYCLVFSC